MHLDGFSPQHNETLSALHQESRELVAENTLNLICLFDLDTNTDRVHRRFDEHPLVFVSGYCQRVEKHLFGASVEKGSESVR
jgi:hypothetical protein